MIPNASPGFQVLCFTSIDPQTSNWSRFRPVRPVNDPFRPPAQRSCSVSQRSLRALLYCSILAPPSKASTSNVSVLLFISLPPLNTLHMLFLPLPNTALPLPPTITTPSLLPSPSATGLNLIVRVKALALKQLITSTKIFAQLIRWKWPSGSTFTCCGLFLQMTHNRRAICARKQAPNYTLNNRFCHGWEMCELAGHRNVFSIMIKRSRDKWN